ncbi:uncharacterized protein LOC124545979 [Schistocerca americana]|uniref:uncharacterized protein LOC124545979 n=1 Tax=Schistocerca americana TaxID=7009 RepID=UPI001F500351|nr:uncharacterized protein LOC124545979 [Schistocerca americana]
MLMPQRRLFSTKKKTARNISLAVPNAEESCEIVKSLLNEELDTNHDVPAEHSRAVPDVQHSKRGLDTKNHLDVVEQPHSMLWQSGVHHGVSGLDMNHIVAVQHGYAIPIVQHSTTGLDTHNQAHVEQPHTMPWQPGVHHGASGPDMNQFVAVQHGYAIPNVHNRA